MSKKRKCNDDYVRFGFFCIGKTKDLQEPQRMLYETFFKHTF